MFSYIASLKLQANPVDASAPYLPPSTPKQRLSSAITTISPPYKSIFCISPASIPLSIIAAVTKGINTSINTSSTIQHGVKIEALLYFPMYFAKVRIILPTPAK